jgi:uncharacterized protein YsxB (DUF464 family)
MLTENDIVNTFLNKIGQPPEQSQIEEYATYSLEELNAILDRRILIKTNPDMLNNIAEDYKNYINASEKDKHNWNFY